MKIELVYVAYNRLEYTRLSLASLLQDPFQDFSIVIWDNGSTDGTREYLSEVQDPRISRKVFPDGNGGFRRSSRNDDYWKSKMASYRKAK